LDEVEFGFRRRNARAKPGQALIHVNGLIYTPHPMPSKREILAELTKDELVSVVDQFDLSVSDRRKRDGLIEAVAASKKATLAEILPALQRDRLKALCQAFEFDDSGREKAVLIERLLNGKVRESAAPSSVRAKSSVPPSSNGAARNGQRGSNGFEQTFRNIDDALRKEAGCTTELDYTEQTSWLLFLKYLDDLEKDRADEAALNGKRYEYILERAFRWDA
jgi:type I restriction enzyme M protein